MNKQAASQTLAILVVLALAASIAGTLINLNKLKTIDVTGLVSSGSGYTNATVVVTSDISFVTGNINFTADAAAGTGNDTVDSVVPPFNLTNDGNVCVNITVVRDQTSWFTGTVIGGDLNNNNHTQYAINTTGTNAAYLSTSNTTWNNLSQSITSEAITGLNWSSGNDTAEIEIKIYIPTDESSGMKSTTVTFAARDSLLNC